MSFLINETAHDVNKIKPECGLSISRENFLAATDDKSLVIVSLVESNANIYNKYEEGAVLLNEP